MIKYKKMVLGENMTDIGNVFILGDSYSTFEGYNPKGYDVWYSTSGNDMTDVTSVSETWWHRLLSETKSCLLENCSFSGTTVCNTGYNGADCKEDSFIARLDKYIEKGFFEREKVDTFFIFGSTNDCWAGSPKGELIYGDIPKAELYKVYPAFSYMLSRVKTVLPEARCIFIMNYGLDADFSEKFSEACKHYGVEFLPLSEFEINMGHPTVKGMKQIKEQVQKYLEEN